MKEPPKQSLEFVQISSLKLNPRSPNRHDKKKISDLARAVKENVFLGSILINEDSRVLAGHARIAAAKKLGWKKIPATRVKNTTEVQEKLFVLSDNKFAERSTLDDDILRLMLEDIQLQDPEVNLELSGFETGELDIILNDTNGAEIAPETTPGPDLDKPAVNRPGDLWNIGHHRVYCGDSLVPASWQTLMGGEKAQMFISDPPYNVPVNGHVSGLGKARHREFVMASGEMSRFAFEAFLRRSFKLMAQFSQDGAIHFVCMDWRHVREVLEAADGVYTEQKNLCVWAKTNAGMGSFYRSQHELVFVFKSGKGKHVNNFGLGESGRHRSNLWTYAGTNTFRKDRMEDLNAHPTVKPIQMVADAIMDCSKRGSIVADAFAGSGTTLLAAHRTGRVGVGVEIDPHYADLILSRLEEETGEPATHSETHESFDTMRKLREQEAADD